jgi:hypothetical protein
MPDEVGDQENDRAFNEAIENGRDHRIAMPERIPIELPDDCTPPGGGTYH